MASRFVADDYLTPVDLRCNDRGRLLDDEARAGDAVQAEILASAAQRERYRRRMAARLASSEG